MELHVLPNPEANETAAWRNEGFILLCLHEETEWKEKEKDVIWSLKRNSVFCSDMLLLIFHCSFYVVSVNSKLMRGLA